MDDDALQLRDLAPVDPFLPDWVLPWWMWLAIALVLAGLAGLVIAIVRRPKKAPAGESAEAMAYRRAVARLKALPDDFHDAVLEASSALRAYLAEASGDPSLFETQEEFIAREEALRELPTELRPKVASYLTELSTLKYDQPRDGSSPEIATSAMAMLEEIHRARPA
ncbi:hypothetical protein [Haloferula sargassicola]|uniref:DUF4129 domain-containing protein n=1 Tax=Haloferula sargassicola TaxID=490096 RepID=A0ABP9USU9_9BACT